MKKLPIGIQSIEKIRTQDYIYVDKTQFALELIGGDAPHYFLSRPRRFGKSLFVSTLAEIFKGNKELFQGCHIYESNYNWQTYPILHLSFGAMANNSTEALKADLSEELTKAGKKYDIKVQGPSLESKLKSLIEGLAPKGQVVVLIDEYDKPLIDNLRNLEVANGNRELLQSFYSTLKSLEDYVRFTFITGISRFSKVSLFSGANHLEDISMTPRYATMMGYTYEEMVQYFDEHLQTISQVQSRTEEKVLEEIKAWYNGYRFTQSEAYVYNPFSTLLFFKHKAPKTYWYASGTPSFLLREIRQRPQATLSLSQMIATQSRLSDISNVEKIPLPALMFQTGYLTIRDYRTDLDAYQLDFPNQEVRAAFFDSILEELTELDSWVVNQSSKQLRTSLDETDLTAFISIINTLFAKIPFHASQHAREGFYQALFLTFLELSGLQAQGEVVTNKGRIDVVCELKAACYIFELKVDQDAAIAMDQAQRQGYSQQYQHQGKKIVIVGISFSSESRDVAEWAGELLDEQGELIQNLAPEIKQ